MTGRYPYSQRHPVLFHGGLGLILAAALATALWYGTSRSWQWQPWLGVWLVGVNLIAFAYYGFDKLQARRSGRRVPERVLHGLVLVGGSIGAYTGMKLLRHKTLKGGFRIVFWVIVLLQAGLIGWLVYWLWPTG